MKSTCAEHHLCRLGSLSFLLTFAVIGTPQAQATELTTHEIVVSDCDGITRAQIQSADATSSHQLKVSLKSDTVMPDTLKLTSEGELAEGKVVRGEASFENLHSGTYQICDDQKLAKIAHISLEPARENSATTIGGIVAGTAALGGTVLALNSGGGSDSSPSTASTANSLSESKPMSGSAPASSKPATSARAPSGSERDCLNGAKVNPISPFD